MGSPESTTSAEADHAHRYLIEIKHGQQIGECKFCHEVREFNPGKNKKFARKDTEKEPLTAIELKAVELMVEGKPDAKIMEATNLSGTELADAQTRFFNTYDKGGPKKIEQHRAVKSAVLEGVIRVALPETLPVLTRAESALFDAVATGFNQRDIQKICHISTTRVATDIQSLRKKTGLTTELQFAAWEGHQERQRREDRTMR